MMWLLSLLARFAPSLLPALKAVANPWLLLAIGGAAAGGFFYGMHLRGALADSFEDQVAAVGRAQEARSAERRALDRLNKERTDREYANTVDALSDRIAALVGRLSGNDPGGSLLPPAGAGARDPDRITFHRPDLDRALRDFAARAGNLVGEGTAAVAALDAARRWNRERERAPPP